ncbi:GNAT family N-acetyltransferase [Paraburkholderia caribensis]|uniref:GNAT family N-acetyltransferase n=1 Tax=Paraburkholderia caribensis TaxID=75105 RepID=UPI001F404B04|nr:GNAT family N-acetyltransferase [Paraburkholderia caribensis]
MATEPYLTLHNEGSEDSPITPLPAIVSTSRAAASAAYSIFHERWWLDIATDGRWHTATVMHGKRVLGEMPYYFARRGVWRVSRLPPLTRSLGPVIEPIGAGGPAAEFRHRMHVTARLIEQLPRFDSFFQVFDHRVNDALAFALRGFEVSARYTFHIAPGSTSAEAWARMSGKTRNVIRHAATHLSVRPIERPSEFLNFYEANLAARSRKNAYGTIVMGELVNAFVERQAGRLLGAYSRRGQLAGVIGIVWDCNHMYYLLSSRSQTTSGGAISLLIWEAIQEAIDRELTFDFDGFSTAAAYAFLSGFGGTLKQRLGVERLGTVYAVARTIRRGVFHRSREAFSANL